MKTLWRQKIIVDEGEPYRNRKTSKRESKKGKKRLGIILFYYRAIKSDFNVTLS